MKRSIVYRQIIQRETIAFERSSRTAAHNNHNICALRLLSPKRLDFLGRSNPSFPNGSLKFQLVSGAITEKYKIVLEAERRFCTIRIYL